jgi:hypothetical protein
MASFSGFSPQWVEVVKATPSDDDPRDWADGDNLSFTVEHYAVRPCAEFYYSADPSWPAMVSAWDLHAEECLSESAPVPEADRQICAVVVCRALLGLSQEYTSRPGSVCFLESLVLSVCFAQRGGWASAYPAVKIGRVTTPYFDNYIVAFIQWALMRGAHLDDLNEEEGEPLSSSLMHETEHTTPPSLHPGF